MDILPSSLQNLIMELSKLPSIGTRSAERLSYHLMKQSDQARDPLSRAISDLTKNIVTCEICQNIAEESPCTVCKNNERDARTICVVEEPWDVIAVESTGEFKGLYHVLGGALSPIDNINPENLTINSLTRRVQSPDSKITELIIATNPSLEGEATAMYITKILRESDVRITRIAHGLPVGSDLEYADQITLGKALEGRREM